MLHEKVWLTNLQIFCPSRDSEILKVHGQLRNLFYAVSFPWHYGNLGRIIPKNVFEDFYGEYLKLSGAFYGLIPADDANFNVTLTYIPFPVLHGMRTVEKEAQQILSAELEERFVGRIQMLNDSLTEEKRFYQSLLTELKTLVVIGFYLKDEINPKILKRIERANSDILCYSAEAIRRSTSVKEDIINVCGALL